jgi:hypothetical protein
MTPQFVSRLHSRAGARPLLSRSLRARFFLACALGASSCGGDSTSPRLAASDPLTLSTTALPALDAAREGRYVLWFLDKAGAAHSAGTITPGSAVAVVTPIADPVSARITVERPGTNGVGPSPQVLLSGGFRDGRASLEVVGAVTQTGVPLRPRPGQFTMFSPSDNDIHGYPSHEEAGVWLFNMNPSATDQKDFYVRMAQLQPGWIYEGWMVRDYGSADEIWLSYGKFLPDWTGTLNSADDTGWGPFSGITDYATYRAEDFPGDDWISNPLHLPFPSQLTLPLNLRERDGSGRLRWTHVISIEPNTDKGEPIGSERPFLLRPYVDPFGDLNPGMPRTITIHPEAVPSAVLTLR